MNEQSEMRNYAGFERRGSGSKIEHGFLNEVKKDMRGEGFEPANDFRADLESASVGHLDTLAKVLILICVNPI